jgi:hypothetical protein
MNDIFASSKICLSRAKEHIIELEKRIKTFFDAKPYTSVIETDPDGIQEIHKVKFTRHLPDNLSAVTADTVNNLLSALDQSWYAVAVASGAVKPGGGKAYFPFADSVSEFESKIQRGCKNIPQDILALLRSFQPYKGGNDLLWALNRVCAANKHYMLAPTGVLTYIDFPHVKCIGTGKADIIRPWWDRRTNEIVYFIRDLRNRIKYKINLSFDIAFDEVEIISGKSALAILKNMTAIVERILLAIEAETRRLGFI